MILKAATIAALTLCACGCTNPKPDVPAHAFERDLEDTTGNRRAKWDLDELQHYNNICKAIGIRPLYNGVDSFEVRAWRQTSVYGMACNEEIYSLAIRDTLVTLTFYRVYCRQLNWDTDDFRHWDPFTQPVVDSFFAVSRSFSGKIAEKLDLQSLWGLKTQSALHISDSIGVLDGTTHSIELASGSRHKLVRYHEAECYYDMTKQVEIERFIADFNELINFFRTKQVYE